MGPDTSARNQLVIVITDGVPNSGDPTAAAAASLQAKADVFAVGVGDGVNQATLETIASGAGDANTFSVGGFGGLSTLLSTLVSAVIVPGATQPVGHRDPRHRLAARARVGHGRPRRRGRR